MNVKEFSNSYPGRLKRISGTTSNSKVFSFIPNKLPPKIKYDLELTNLLAQELLDIIMQRV